MKILFFLGILVICKVEGHRGHGSHEVESGSHQNSAENSEFYFHEEKNKNVENSPIEVNGDPESENGGISEGLEAREVVKESPSESKNLPESSDLQNPVDPEVLRDSEASENSEVPKNSEVVENSEAPKDSEALENSEILKDSEASKDSETPKDPEILKDSEALENSEVLENSEAPKDSEAPSDAEVFNDSEVPIDPEEEKQNSETLGDSESEVLEIEENNDEKTAPESEAELQENEEVEGRGNEGNSEIIPEPGFEIPDDEKFPPEMLPEQPKDVLVKKASEETDSQVPPSEDVAPEVEPSENMDSEVELSENMDSEVELSENMDSEVELSEKADSKVEPSEDVDSNVLPSKNMDSEVEPSENVDSNVLPSENMDSEVKPSENVKSEAVLSGDYNSEVQLSEDEQPAPEVDIDSKTLENFKSASGGVAFDVPLEASSDVEEKKENSETFFPDDDESGQELVPETPQIVDPEVVFEDKPVQENSDSNLGEKKESEVLAVYPSEAKDFSVDHETGLMPSETNILSEKNPNSENSNYEILEKIRNEMDRGSKGYVVTEELIDPVQDRRKFIVQKPSYRAFDPKENPIINSIKTTLDENARLKRDVSESSASFEAPESGLEREKHVEEDSSQEVVVQPSGVLEFPRPPGDQDSGYGDDPLLEHLADALEKAAETNFQDLSPESENSENLKQLQNFEYEPVPLVQEKKLEDILKFGGPVMIEPESYSIYQPALLPQPLYEGSYEIPQKVVVETNQKLTVYYDESSESSESRDSESDSSLEKTNPKNPEIADSENQDEIPETFEKTEFLPDSSLAEASNIFSKNLILTLSISPKMMVILGILLVIVLCFKIYFLLYTPKKPKIETKEEPISVITVDKKPLP